MSKAEHELLLDTLSQARTVVRSHHQVLTLILETDRQRKTRRPTAQQLETRGAEIRRLEKLEGRLLRAFVAQGGVVA